MFWERRTSEALWWRFKKRRRVEEKNSGKDGATTGRRRVRNVRGGSEEVRLCGQTESKRRSHNSEEDGGQSRAGEEKWESRVVGAG